MQAYGVWVVIFLTSLFLFTRISKVHSLNMAKARTISHVVFDRNAFLPSLKLNPLTVLSGLVEVWSLSGEIVAVLETSATLWLPLLNENSNVRVFDDLPLRRSFVPHDRQHTTFLAMVNVWTRSNSVLTILNKSHLCIVGASFVHVTTTCFSGFPCLPGLRSLLHQIVHFLRRCFSLWEIFKI